MNAAADPFKGADGTAERRSYARQDGAPDSLYRRLRTTPMRDVLRGRLTGRLSTSNQVDAARLPAPLAGIVSAVVGKSRLWRIEKTEVANELIAHFQDGLAAGEPAETLAKAFGDPSRAARLIRRAKKRNRPLIWQSGRWIARGVALLLLLYVLLALRFFLVQPTISHNYLADLNRAALAVPPSERAWPVYRQALLSLPKMQELMRAGGAGYIRPEDPEWTEAAAMIAGNAQAIATIRRAAALPGLGYVASNTISPEDRSLWPDQQASNVESEDFLFTVLLPHVSEMRRMAFVLSVDGQRALLAGDGETFVADCTAAIGLARHVREQPLLIADLVSISITNLVLQQVNEALVNRPDSLSEAQWRELAHRIAALADRDLKVRLTGERMGFQDFMQRIYSDNGSGDGRVTFKGMKMLQMTLASPQKADQFDPTAGLGLAVSPALSLVMLSRRDMLTEHARLMDQLQADAELPLWERGGSGIDQQLGQWMSSPMQEIRYLPLVRLLPAVEKASVNSELVVQARDATLTAIALELYRRAHGDWPARLDSLVPTYLPTIPPDRFDGAPIKYALIDGKPVLYSVGVDRDDNGGQPPRHASGKPDHEAARRWAPLDSVQASKAGTNWGAPGTWPACGDWILFPPSSPQRK